MSSESPSNATLIYAGIKYRFSSKLALKWVMKGDREGDCKEKSSTSIEGISR